MHPEIAKTLIAQHRDELARDFAAGTGRPKRRRRLPRLCCSSWGRVRVCQRGRRLRLGRWFCLVRRRYPRLRRRCL